jgi:hypothetical protein
MMILVVAIAALLIPQILLAELEFRYNRPGLADDEELLDQGPSDDSLPAAILKLYPLQVYTHPTVNWAEVPVPWWNLDQDFYETVAFIADGSGDYKVTATVTDVKTGTSHTFPHGTKSAVNGLNYLTLGPTSISGSQSNLPRVFKLTYSLKVGTSVKSVSTKIFLH